MATPILEEALSYIRRKRAELVAQFDDSEMELALLQDRRSVLMQQIHWLDLQYKELEDQSKAERKPA